MEENQVWRVTEKERERERRRMRDRQRRQSMSIEERERHLARRRRNYQLRRQRAAAGMSPQLLAIKNDDDGGRNNDTVQDRDQPSTSSKDHHLLPFVSTFTGSSLQPTLHGDDNQIASSSTHPLLVSGETTRSYRYPRVLRLTQIKLLARKHGGPGTTNHEENSNKYIHKEMSSLHESNFRRGIRLIHIKHLARSLSSTTNSVPKPSIMIKEEHPCRTQRDDSIMIGDIEG